MKTLADIRAHLPVYPIELPFPDISQWKTSNTGIDYIHTFDSGMPGPHVMLMALVHGNEVSGAIIVDMLLKAGLRPVKGRLSFGFANVEAYRRFSASDPDAARYVDEDLNRVWGEAVLDGPRTSSELARARELRPFLDSVDLLLDLHSMHEASMPLMMCGPLDKGIALAAEIGFPEHVVIDAGHASGKRLRDYGGFGDPGSPKNALLLEAGQHFSSRSRDVALEAACRFLMHSGVISFDDLQPFLAGQKRSRQHFIHITHSIVARSMDFSFAATFQGLETIPKRGTIIARDGDIEITTPYDDCVIIQPSLRHLAPGVTVMRLGRIVDRTNPQNFEKSHDKEGSAVIDSASV
jgi:predicted deacylase